LKQLVTRVNPPSNGPAGAQGGRRPHADPTPDKTNDGNETETAGPLSPEEYESQSHDQNHNSSRLPTLEPFARRHRPGRVRFGSI
jgi:hypothetical protein